VQTLIMFTLFLLFMSALFCNKTWTNSALPICTASWRSVLSNWNKRNSTKPEQTMHCQSAQLHEGVCFQTEIKETAQNHKKSVI